MKRVERKCQKQVIVRLTFGILTILLVHTTNAFAKPTFAEAKTIWLDECHQSLFVALREFGSKKLYHNDREKVEVIKDVCDPAAEAQVQHALEHPKLSIESHACFFVSEQKDTVVGFGRTTDNSMEFGFRRCNKL